MMTKPSPVTIAGAGLVTPVGHSLQASSAAMRCRINQHRETGFVDRRGNLVSGAGVMALDPMQGPQRLASMLLPALQEAADNASPSSMPIVLNLAAPSAPGYLADLPASLRNALEQSLGKSLHEDSVCIQQGSCGIAQALVIAEQLLYAKGHESVLVASVDSLLNATTLGVYDRDSRLLSSNGEEGFIPGEAAAALKLIKPTGVGGELRITGLGLAKETCRPGGELPSQGRALAAAMGQALDQAGIEKSDLRLSISNMAGESFYFRETSLAWARVKPKQRNPAVCWLPAESIGHVGAAASVVALAWLKVAQDKGYAPGVCSLCHFADDDGERVAVVCEFKINERGADDGS